MTIATAPTLDPQPLFLDVSNTTLTVTPEQFDFKIPSKQYDSFIRGSRSNIKLVT